MQNKFNKIINRLETIYAPKSQKSFFDGGFNLLLWIRAKLKFLFSSKIAMVQKKLEICQIQINTFVKHQVTMLKVPHLIISHLNQKIGVWISRIHITETNGDGANSPVHLLNRIRSKVRQSGAVISGCVTASGIKRSRSMSLDVS